MRNIILILVLCSFVLAATNIQVNAQDMTGTEAGEVNTHGGAIDTDGGEISTGDVSASSVSSTGDISGSNVTASGTLSGTNVSASGTVSTGNASVSNTVWSSQVSASNYVDANSYLRAPTTYTNTLTPRSGSTVRISSHLNGSNKNASNFYQVTVNDTWPNSNSALSSKYYTDQRDSSTYNSAINWARNYTNSMLSRLQVGHYNSCSVTHTGNDCPPGTVGVNWRYLGGQAVGYTCCRLRVIW